MTRVAPAALLALALLALLLVAPGGARGDALVAVAVLALLPVALLRVARPFGVGLLALAAALHFVAPTAGRLHTWNLFHYTVGARFFGELGYHDLYVAALAADAAGDDSLRHVRTVRDLHTYERVPRHALPPWDPRERLAPARLAELQRTIDLLEPGLPRETWREVFLDRGYNATPAYTAVAGRVADLLPPHDPVTLRLATLLDPVLLLGGVGAVLWAFGAEAALLALLALVVWPGTEDRLAGGFLGYDWLAALMVAAAAVRRERPVLAAVALSWAAASRLFPVLLAVGLLLPALRRRLAGEALPPFERAFLVAFPAFSALWLFLGCTTPRGPAAWAEFVPRILHHTAAHAWGERRVGLRHLLTLSPGSADEEVRMALVEARAPLWVVLAGVGVAAGVAAAGRRTREEAMQLGWLAVFVLAVSSRYYWAGLVLVALLPGARGRWLAGGVVAASAVGHVAIALRLGDYGSWVAIEAAVALLLAIWAAAGPSRT